MTKQLKWWNKKQEMYVKKEWIDKTTIFASEAINYFPSGGKLLELGAGQGQDSRFFAKNGYKVVSTDFSETALHYCKLKSTKPIYKNITFEKLDLSVPFHYKDNSFDIVYSHMSLHYFDNNATKRLFSEVFRVLKKNGLLAFIVNSTADPEYKTGNKLEKDYYELGPGDVKRFFSISYTKQITKNFKTMLLDNNGKTHKDLAKGVSNQIRYIGKRP